MVKIGKAPFYECSSKGDKRFSAFCAYIKVYGDTIENLYQAAKIFEDGSSGLSWREAKGKRAVNMTECAEFYSHLWDIYFKENPPLLELIKSKSGFSDMFGQQGRQCQALEIWRIKNV